ncbi:bifunctional metallophosphatase/5'-nucleotidase [Kurthia sibirica]|uniref:Bifunctional metallophosphatase/5'-nucleotidase n=1 Tax=Kurthia sibirica TaxID=202750 RepID=A0A2U3AIN7_9BACL|nr:bifunctional UDP-sugar hydrolase/5'-nucleotidase [Kurthia sibirica]PWI24422.1 bifunctional metallophosphatase/5'-nucleotidase [Kurthia sibirica]GEK33840.1 putative metallophosphoesterase YunD [Kurthia sibirica]
MTQIHIYHTNDIHSHLKSWPRTRAYLQQRRQEHASQQEACFIFDLGDFIDRADIYTEASLGSENIKLLDEAGYDAITIGNNEGITLAKEALTMLYSHAEFDVILSNLKELDGSQPNWAQRYKIFEVTPKIKMGVIAATAPFADYYSPLGWQIMEPIENLQQVAMEVAPQVDFLICLSHLGLPSDEELAQLIPQLDLIIGAHTHHVLPKGKKVNHSLLTGGGKFGRYIGHSTITLQAEGKKVETMLVATDDLQHIEGETREVMALERWGKEVLDVELFQATRYYNKEWFHDSHLSRLFAQALLDYSQADCTFYNAGIFLQPLQKGPVSAFDLHQMLPHPINACILNLTADELLSCLQRIEAHPEWPFIAVKGLGFRGQILGKMLQYGCVIKNGELYVNGQLKKGTEIIKLVTLDLFTFGWFFPEFKAMEKKYLLPHFLRDILSIYGYKFFGK